MGKRKSIDEKVVKAVAALSRFELSREEVKKYCGQLADILEYIHKLNEVDSADTPPTSHPLPSLKNVFRKDVVQRSLTPEEALQNAPKRVDNFFRVPRIIE